MATSRVAHIWLGRGPVTKGLDVIYRYLQNVKLFTKAIRKSIGSSRVEEGLKYLKEVRKLVTTECRANKEVMKTITKFSCKSAARSSMMKTALKTTIKANSLKLT